MKKPASIVSAIVFNCLFLGLNAVMIFGPSQNKTALVFIGPALFGLIHGLALVGLFTRGRWAWYMNIVPLGLWIAGFFAMTIFFHIKKNGLFQAIPILVVIGFMGWLFYAIAFGSAAKQYLFSDSERQQTEGTE